jgi:hypothetical protein
VLLLLQILILFKASAHPVTFQGGTMLKNMSREDMSETSMTYTFRRQMAVGLELDRLLLGSRETHWGLVEINGLLKRWNGEHSQGNIYLLSGAGGLFSDFQEEWAGKWGLQLDYETRKFYTLLSFSSWHSETIDTNYVLSRVGFAPFVAGYNDLNIWAILQLDYNKDMRNEVQVSPFLRFYYKNILWEIGSSLRGNYYWQFMVHI